MGPSEKSGRSAHGAQFSTIYAFGASLSDGGNDAILTVGRIPISPPYYRTSYGPFGTFTAAVFSNGPVWVQALWTKLFGTGSKLTPSLYGGTDYAYGGAEANPQESGISGLGASAIGLNAQLAQFGAGRSDALYTLSIGANDIQAILEQGGPLQDMTRKVASSVAAELSFVTKLVNGGARNLLVLDVPDMSKVPVVRLRNENLDLAARLSKLYNVQLNAGLEGLAQARGVAINILPTYWLLDDAVANPSKYGLSNVTDPAWTGNYTDAKSGTQVSDPSHYLFWDSYHPTGYVHQVIANDAAALVTSGTQLPAPTVRMADNVTGQNSLQFGTVSSGAYPQVSGEFVYPAINPVTIAANTPSLFIKATAGNDSLQVTSGDNVLDGGGGSDMFSGGSGNDMFVVEASPAAPGWDVIQGAHPGDVLRIFGPFQPGVSAAGLTFDGPQALRGATVTTDYDGAGGPDLAVTFAGVSLPTASPHFLFSVGSSASGTYLQVRYT